MLCNWGEHSVQEGTNGKDPAINWEMLGFLRQQHVTFITNSGKLQGKPYPSTDVATLLGRKTKDTEILKKVAPRLFSGNQDSDNCSEVRR